MHLCLHPPPVYHAVVDTIRRSQVSRCAVDVMQVDINLPKEINPVSHVHLASMKSYKARRSVRHVRWVNMAMGLD